MEVGPILTGVEAAVSTQLAAGGADPAVEAAASSLLAALEPALRRAALELAQQAAEEVAAQLPGYQVDVVLADGEPTLRIHEESDVPAAQADDYEARITLRVPAALKGLVEEAAGETGDSVNSWVVKALSSRARRRRRRGRRVSGTFDL